jgi:hypothetical protein
MEYAMSTLMLGNGTRRDLWNSTWVGTFLVPTRFGFNESKHPWMDEDLQPMFQI